MRRDLPTGAVTFLFTDVEGSTLLLRDLGDGRYADALTEHRRIIRKAVVAHSGIEVDTQGDAIFAAFPTAAGAVSAARDAQEALAAGPIRVRMGLHTGTPLRTAEGYVGVDVHRGARIAAVGHGGQVLISSTTASLLGTDLPTTDLGVHRLKDLEAGERIHQLGADPFPPLRSLSASNLPEPGEAIIGRADELLDIGELVRDPHVRLLTIVGPGGIGKTRVAVEVAAGAVSAFPDGRWWVPLAARREAAQAIADVGRVLGLGEDSTTEAIRRHLVDRRCLLVLDNAEHLLPDLADALAELLPGSGGSTFLVTSRGPLRLTAERLVRLAELSADDAVQLLIARAGALGVTLRPTEALATLADRLDRLPLALSLVAARLPMLSVDQVLERLGQRLDLFAASRDADPRQQTLRATIEWSHDLLTDDERTLLHRLSAFAGGWTLEAAETVADAELDALQGLLDRSIVLRTDGAPPRFTMHESIRVFAAEQLAASGAERTVRDRHAAWIRALAERVDEQLQSGEPEERWVSLLTPEIDNLRAAFAHGLQTGDAATVRAIAAALPMFWVMRGRVAEGRGWIERALDLDPAEDAMRRSLLSGLAILAYMSGDHAAATLAADDAAGLATRLGPSLDRSTRLRAGIAAAMAHDDFATAEPLFEALLGVARAEGNGVRTSACRINLAYIANRTGRHERAEALMAENLPFVRARGQSRCEATSLVTLAETATYLGRPAEAVEYAVAAAAIAPRVADEVLLVADLRWYAAAAARLGEAMLAARALGACEAAEAELDAALAPHEAVVREALVATLRGSLTDAELDAERATGRDLGLSGVAALIHAPVGEALPA